MRFKIRHTTTAEIALLKRGKVYPSVNSATVNAYLEIGKTIYEACGENVRAAYGEKLFG